MSARSKARVCGRWRAGIAGSNPAGERLSVCFECFELSDRGLCNRPIPRSEESYRLRVCVCACACVYVCVIAGNHVKR